MKTWAFFFYILSLTAFAPILIVILGNFEGGFFARIECLFSEYSGTITSLGTLFLVSGLALMTTHLSSQSTAKSNQASRDLNAEMKISEFRQTWINILRDDLAEIISLAYIYFEGGEQTRDEKLRKMKNLDAKIRMRLNPKPTADAERAIESELIALVDSCQSNKEEKAKSHRETLAKLGANFLKDEWDALKLKLEKVKEVKDQ